MACSSRVAHVREGALRDEVVGDALRGAHLARRRGPWIEAVRVSRVDRDAGSGLLLNTRVVEDVVRMPVRVQDLDEPQTVAADRGHRLALAA